jgi:hypothetical protein
MDCELRSHGSHAGESSLIMHWATNQVAHEIIGGASTQFWVHSGRKNNEKRLQSSNNMGDVS